MQIRKRDDSLVEFDVQKISRAVAAAWEEVHGVVDDTMVERVSGDVVRGLPQGVAVTVEHVQDAVEVALMRLGEFAVAKAYILYRQMRAAARGAKKPDPNGLSAYIHASKYARYREDLGRRETYEETVARVEDMHLRRFPQLAHDIRWAFDLVREKRVLPSMRAMQFGGAAMEANNARGFNCSATLIDRPRAFAEALYLLLCGCGVGYSVQFRHVDKLPPIARQPTNPEVVHHVVRDTIEGWADAAHALVSAAIAGQHVEFAYHEIRQRGAPLKTSGGRAPGHLGLKEALERARSILLGAQGRQLRPIEVHEILCHFADAVRAGGIRRCLPKGALVHLTRGLVPIEEVRVGDTVRTARGWSSVTNTVVQGEQPLVRIVTQMGPFECTANHRVAVLSSTSEYVWKEAGTLVSGDRLIFVDHVIEGSVTTLPTWTYQRSPHDHTGVDIRIPNLDVDVAWFLGYLHGNGYVHVNHTTKDGGSSVVSFAMCDSDAETPERVSRLHTVLRRFGVNSNDVKLNGEDTRRVSASVKQLALYCEKFKRPKEPLSVPRCVLEGFPEIRAAYLAGLFDADGAASNRPVLLLASIYPEFLQQVQAVYASLGIATRIKLNRPERGNWQALWYLNLVGEIPRRNFDLRVAPYAVKRATERAGSQFDYGYPREFIFDADVNYYGKWSPSNLQMTAGTFERCGGNRHGMLPVTVMEVVPGRTAPTYDITVEGDHEFVAQGLLVHNSAMIGLFSLEDSEMMYCKSDASWFSKKPWLARANNSVVLKRDSVTWEQFSRIFKMTRNFGEPGFMFVADWDHVFNPCGEAGLDPVFVLNDDARLTGWNMCNLCEINAAAIKTVDDFVRAARAATIIGTLQAAYTDMPYLGQVTEQINRRDALLGIGMTGMQDAAEIVLDPDIQQFVARCVLAWNKTYAERLNINSAARTTIVKPSGTTTLELMCEMTPAIGSGIHRHHHSRYIRRVTADELEAPFQHFREKNPTMCVQRPDGTWCIEYPVEVSPNSRLRDDQGAVDFLAEVRSTQQNWVRPGTARDSHRPGLTHNVSNTVSVRPEEWDDVAKYVWEHRGDFAGVSFLPHDGDIVYQFAPLESVKTPAQQKRWQELVDAYVPIDYTIMIEGEDATALGGEAACAGGACER